MHKQVITMVRSYFFQPGILLLALIVGCGPVNSFEEATHPESTADLEAREDSLEMVRALELQEKIERVVIPDVETKAVMAGNLDDAADDPAVWIHPETPERSLVIGSNKRGGIATYTL